MASTSMSHHSTNPLIARARSTRVAAAHAHSPFESSASNVSLFLTNLRLLDLDRLPDWPEISALTFAAKDAGQGQKRRIQCVEWALYQLFVLWDIEEARHKLQPFFPPLDQLQSTNLRAALLRSLERLKKNGVFGRDVVLRKTMLDECKGERLEEVLAVFSSTVLKKCVSEEQLHTKAHAAIAQSLALENRGFSSERTELGVLVLAHKSSLRRKLEHHEVSRAQYQELEDLFDARQEELEKRWHRLRANAKETQTTSLSEKDKARIHQTLRNNWSGNEQWQEAVLYGDSRSQRDGVLAAPFDRVWRRTRSNRLAELHGHHTGLLGQLDSRVRAQQERLDKWQKFGSAMFGNSYEHGRAEDASAPARRAKGIVLAFGLHEALVTRSVSGQDLSHTSESCVRGEYAELLHDIDAELADTARAPDSKISAFLSSHQRPTSTSRQKTDLNTIESKPDRAEDPLSEHSDFEMHLAEPSEPESLRRPLLDDTQGFQNQGQSGRGPPLQASTTFAAQSNVPSGMTRASSPQTHYQHHGQAPLLQHQSHASPIFEDSEVPDRLSTHCSDSSNPLPLPATHQDAPTQSPEQLLASRKQQQADEILAFMDGASSSPTKEQGQRHTLSLEERTRLSMGRFDTTNLDEEDGLGFGSVKRLARHASSSQTTAKGTMSDRASTFGCTTTQAMHSATAGSAEEDDLVARTRRSMANFENTQQKAKLERRRSERIAARHHSGSIARQSYFAPTEEASGSQDDETSAIVLEELMAREKESTGADYESIFKSRPKIKSSPPSTPIHGGFEWK
ncbi:HAUS augmin-like complex subunit 6 N-terminus-domain-containing protein [Coniella lustricola]|uniref:HAUS augmin-like complex subunit 6 N-terminus-domain-containing protein n=1 Tax=Coniella lustricola TaxID=2025994 RepID=A0A2T2ZZX9_9PEZI|nr:HAUS augmin-like complex subunit 6 N-terminus-domain-containing protein [Coniella lustricola]